MKPKIYLHNKTEKSASILLRYMYKPKNRFNYGLGIIIHPSAWDEKKQRVSRKEPHHSSYNLIIEKLEKACIDIRTKYFVSGQLDQLTIALFREELEKAIGIHKAKRLNALQFFEQYIDRYSANVKKAYKTSLNRLKDFSKQKPFDWEDINLNWLYDFQEYCFGVLNLAPNTANKTLVHFKTVLRYAKETGVHENDIYLNKRFTIKKTRTENIYLTLEELSKIYHQKLENERLVRIRDIFIIACFTGQRIGDWSKFNKENVVSVDGNDMFHILTSKTKKRVSIPLHPVVRTLCEKYNWELPKFTDQYVNRSIKTICELAGIKEPVFKTQYKNNQPFQKRFYKYELVSSHTARRSFATNCYKTGMAIELIMAITGHSKTSQLMEYIKATSIERALQAKKNDFFTGKGFLAAI